MAQTPKALRRAKKALDRGAYVTAYLLARSYCEGSTAFDKGHGLSIRIMHAASYRYTAKVFGERMAAVEASARLAIARIRPAINQFAQAFAGTEINTAGIKWRDPAPRILGSRPTVEVFDEVAPEHKQALADYIEKTKNDTGFFSEDCVE